MKQTMLRAAAIEDFEAIRRIENDSFADPWTDQAIMDMLVLSDAEGSPEHVLVSDNGAVNGFILFSVIMGEAEIYDVAVAPESRGNGVGRSLVDEVLSRAESVFLEVREGNTAARRLYEKCGFESVSVRKGYYKGGENAIVMKAKGECANVPDSGN